MAIVAYLDSGSTSMLVGAVAAGGAAVAVAAKVGWRRATGVFRGKSGDADTATEPADATDSQPGPEAGAEAGDPAAATPDGR